MSRKKGNKDELIVLEKLEGVRTRPTMYIGSCGQDGLHHCLMEIISNSVDEYLAGHCRNIIVKSHEDGSVSVCDDGRGIPVATHSKIGTSQLELALTRLHAGSKFFQKSDSFFSSGLNGVGASCVNALSTWMTAAVRRNGGTFYQKYERGVPVSKVSKVRKGHPFKHGTSITFLPDDGIFETITFDPEYVSSLLDDLAYLNPGLKIRYVIDETNEYEAYDETYLHEGGLTDYVKYITEEMNVLRQKPIEIEVKGGLKDKHGHVFHYKLHAVVSFVEDDTVDFRSFVNNVPTTEGGTHYDGFISGMGKAVSSYARSSNIRGSDKVKPSDVTASGFVCLLSFYMHEPRFASQTKKKLTNIEVTKVVDTITSGFFSSFLADNQAYARAIVSRALENAQRREQIEDLRAVSKKTSHTALVAKLAECSTKIFEARELWLVEGDSAAGSMKMGRDPKTQAILPLRGKVLNVERTSLRAVTAHEELMDVTNALGTGLATKTASTFDFDKLRYGKLVIACDADADGGHIRVLLLTFIFRYLFPLLKAGRVYMAQPPLYGIFTKRGKKVGYCKTERALQKAIRKIEGKGLDMENFSVQRYKGLGEMNPEQLWDTTMNPDTRTLLRVTVPDVERASSLISLLMGKDVESRRAFIEEHALDAAIDV